MTMRMRAVRLTWRRERVEGESLKAFARRVGKGAGTEALLCRGWLAAKRGWR